MKPREPFFKPECADASDFLGPDDELGCPTEVLCISLDKANRLVEPLLIEKRWLEGELQTLRIEFKKREEENERLREEIAKLHDESVVQKTTLRLAEKELAALKVEFTKVNTEIEHAPVVYGMEVNGRLYTWCDEDGHPNHTHTARLVRIEEIKK